MFERAATISGIVGSCNPPKNNSQRSETTGTSLDQHLPEIAESIGVPRQTLRGLDVPLWTVGERRTLVKLRDCPSINVDRYCWLGLYALRHPSPG